MYGIEVVEQDSPDCIQAALHTREQMAQSSNCFIYNGLNGTPDWNSIGDFTRETSKKVKRRNHLQLSLPLKVRITNINDANVHCPEGHLLIEFIVKSLRAYIRDNELQRHDSDKYCGYLSDTIWCDRCQTALVRRECRVYHCGWRGCIYDVCASCYSENHHDGRLYPGPVDLLMSELSSDEDADGASGNEC